MNWVRGLLEGSSLNKLSMVIGNFFVQEVVVDSFFYCEWGSVLRERVSNFFSSGLRDITDSFFNCLLGSVVGEMVGNFSSSILRGVVGSFYNCDLGSVVEDNFFSSVLWEVVITGSFFNCEL